MVETVATVRLLYTVKASVIMLCSTVWPIILQNFTNEENAEMRLV
jgi:hypothetical protein